MKMLFVILETVCTFVNQDLATNKMKFLSWYETRYGRFYTQVVL